MPTVCCWGRVSVNNMKLMELEELFRTNSFNLEAKDLDIPIYRVFKIRHLRNTLTKRKNTLVRPSLWDDPFENVLLNVPFYMNNEEISVEIIRDMIYGQCWTMNENETDALWRIYSPNKDGVRVKTTLRKLWNSFANLEDNRCELSYFIGKVQYKSADHIIYPLISNLKSYFVHEDSRALANTLFYKRIEFQHENEIRIIFKNRSTQNYGNLYEHNFDFLDNVEEILFDPRISDEDYETEKKYFTRADSNVAISKSTLYKMPDLRIDLLTDVSNNTID